MVAWQKARLLTGEVYAVTREEPFRRDLGLSAQLQRASVCIIANIAEGFERRSRKGLARYLAMAGASCGEVRSHLYVALDAGYIDKPAFDQLTPLTEETPRLISSFITSLRAAP